MNGHRKFPQTDCPKRRSDRLLNMPTFESSNLRTFFASNPFPFIRFRTLYAQWSISNSFTFNHFRTLSHPMEGVGLALNVFHESPVTNPRRLRCKLPPSVFNELQDAPPARPFAFILLHCCTGWVLPLCPSSLALNPEPQAPALSFQQLTTVAICNPFVLITLQQWGGWGALIFHFHFSIFRPPLGKEVKPPA